MSKLFITSSIISGLSLLGLQSLQACPVNNSFDFESEMSTSWLKSTKTKSQINEEAFVAED